MYSKLSFQDEFTYTWSTPERADTFALNNPGVNTIQVDDSNNPFILFSIWNDPAIYDCNIYASKKINDSWSTDNLTSTFPTPGVLPITYLDVNLATGKDGEMYAAWEDKPTEIVNQWEVLFSHYTPTTGWTTPEIVSPIFDGVGIDKYDDGYTPVDGATAIYNMGPATYELAGNTTVLQYETATSKSIVSSFNPYYIFPQSDQQQYLTDVIKYFGVTNTDSILLVDDDNRYNNEGIIQSSVLRAAKARELDYSASDSKSRIIGSLIERMIKYPDSKESEALPEFLLALCTGKLQIKKDHISRLKDVEFNAKDYPVLFMLGELVKVNVFNKGTEASANF